ncbi:unannotated protein [freshwater metagenome]|uniref:Unannotated protein n=1 Tax=freshwater metagenome TaxID=449393 RepID=A0A6J7JXQ6_9ZZZZ
MSPFALITAPASTVRSSPAASVTEPSVEKMVTPPITSRRSLPLVMSSPEKTLIDFFEIMSVLIVTGLDVRTLIAPPAWMPVLSRGVTPPTRRPPTFQSQTSPPAETSMLPDGFRASAVASLAMMRRVAVPTLPEAISLAWPEERFEVPPLLSL